MKGGWEKRIKKVLKTKLKKKENLSMERIEKEMFEDIIVFSVSEPGAMGPNDITFYKRSGECFTIDYLDDETYMELREAFPVLKECFWNGAGKEEKECEGTVVVGVSPFDKRTHVAAGWKHIYLDFGNHLAVREEYYERVVNCIKGHDNCKITFYWTEMLQKSNCIWE